MEEILEIAFKSFDANYRKEVSDVKNNTQRTFIPEEADPKEEILKKWIRQPFPLRIMIFNRDTGEHFDRIVRDVNFWQGTYTITWEELE